MARVDNCCVSREDADIVRLAASIFLAFLHLRIPVSTFGQQNIACLRRMHASVARPYVAPRFDKLMYTKTSSSYQPFGFIQAVRLSYSPLPVSLSSSLFAHQIPHRYL
jgi:hypothetical protein